MQRGFDVARTRISVFDALLRARDMVGGTRPILEDHDRKPLSYNDIVRASFALGGQLKRFTAKGETVGVLLPTGVGCMVVFLALLAAGRIPAMLNFTAGAMNLEAACQTAKVKVILTADKFIEQARLDGLVEALSRVTTVVRLEGVRKKIGLPQKLGALVAGAFPKAFRAKASPDDTAVILFTSGSFGAPRGVVLSHQNLVANAEQAAAHITFEPHWVFFNPLPMFHSFGLTAGALLPLLRGHKTVLYPSPLHYKEVPKLIKETGAHVLFATDTFAYQYARAGHGEDLRSLVFAVLGAEKVQRETRELFAKQDVVLVEGYGCTECAPVLAVNDPKDNRIGTVGRLLPGVEYKLELAPGIREGMRLVVRGPNVMKGYLNPDGAMEAPPGGWHDTGDIVTVGPDGHVTIQGRAKRFAKIAGEMVSLAAVEGYAAAVWPEHRHAAVAIACSRRGEKIVLVTDNPEADAAALQAWMHANGAPELAAPKRILRLADIPALGTGKTDYVAIKALVEQDKTIAEAA